MFLSTGERRKLRFVVRFSSTCRRSFLGEIPSRSDPRRATDVGRNGQIRQRLQERATSNFNFYILLFTLNILL